jgi:hypothetical protein
MANLCNINKMPNIRQMKRLAVSAKVNLGGVQAKRSAMTISSSMTVTAVAQASARAPVQPSPPKDINPAGPAQVQAKPVATEMRPTQPVAMPPVVTALTADFAAGRVAAEAARAAYQAQVRQSQG